MKVLGFLPFFPFLLGVWPIVRETILSNTRRSTSTPAIPNYNSGIIVHQVDPRECPSPVTFLLRLSPRLCITTDLSLMAHYTSDYNCFHCLNWLIRAYGEYPEWIKMLKWADILGCSTSQSLHNAGYHVREFQTVPLHLLKALYHLSLQDVSNVLGRHWSYAIHALKDTSAFVDV